MANDGDTKEDDGAGADAPNAAAAPAEDSGQTAARAPVRSWTEEEDRALARLVHEHVIPLAQTKEKKGKRGKYQGRQWRLVAAGLPGRDSSRCRERWRNHVDPDVRRDPWTAEEDAVILEGYRKLGGEWRQIAAMLPPGRTSSAVKNRWWGSLKSKVDRYGDDYLMAEAGAEDAEDADGGDDNEDVVDTPTKPKPKRKTKPKAGDAAASGAQAKHNTGVTKTPWTAEEDLILMERHDPLADKLGKWVDISESLPGRTAEAVKMRWRNVIRKKVEGGWRDEYLASLRKAAGMDANVDDVEPKSTSEDAGASVTPAATPRFFKKSNPWTAMEDLILVEQYEELGDTGRNKWAAIAESFQGRTTEAVKKRWHYNIRAKVEGDGGDEYVQSLREAATADWTKAGSQLELRPEESEELSVAPPPSPGKGGAPRGAAAEEGNARCDDPGSPGNDVEPFPEEMEAMTTATVDHGGDSYSEDDDGSPPRHGVPNAKKSLSEKGKDEKKKGRQPRKLPLRRGRPRKVDAGAAEEVESEADRRDAGRLAVARKLAQAGRGAPLPLPAWDGTGESGTGTEPGDNATQAEAHPSIFGDAEGGDGAGRAEAATGSGHGQKQRTRRRGRARARKTHEMPGLGWGDDGRWEAYRSDAEAVAGVQVAIGGASAALAALEEAWILPRSGDAASGGDADADAHAHATETTLAQASDMAIDQPAGEGAPAATAATETAQKLNSDLNMVPEEQELNLSTEEEQEQEPNPAAASFSPSRTSPSDDLSELVLTPRLYSEPSPPLAELYDKLSKSLSACREADLDLAEAWDLYSFALATLHSAFDHRAKAVWEVNDVAEEVRRGELAEPGCKFNEMAERLRRFRERTGHADPRPGKAHPGVKRKPGRPAKRRKISDDGGGKGAAGNDEAQVSKNDESSAPELEEGAEPNEEHEIEQLDEADADEHEESELGLWLNGLRKEYRAGRLQVEAPHRARDLAELGVEWDKEEVLWQRMYGRLREFRDKYGHVDVPWRLKERARAGGKHGEEDAENVGYDVDAGADTSAGEGHGEGSRYSSLRHWLDRQRALYRSGNARRQLRPDRIRALEDLGVAWDVREARWDAFFAELRVFHEHNGHFRVGRDYPGNPKLYEWVRMQRYIREKAEKGEGPPLEPRREQMLNEIGFDWEFTNTGRRGNKWEEYYVRLIEFRARHGHCNVPNEYKDDPLLGQWVKHQRKYYSQMRRGVFYENQVNALTEDRIRKLNDVGFLWESGRFRTWDERFEDLCAWQLQHGRAAPTRGENEYINLWVRKMRKYLRDYEKGRKVCLTEDKIEKLRSVGIAPGEERPDRQGPRNK